VDSCGLVLALVFSPDRPAVRACLLGSPFHRVESLRQEVVELVDIGKGAVGRGGTDIVDAVGGEIAMSSYQRSPKKAVAQCRMPGCRWTRIYFADSTKRMRCAARAQQALDTHVRRAHRVKTLINGR